MVHGSFDTIRLVVLGAGAIGSVVGTVLPTRKEVEHLLIADQSLTAARALAEKLRADHVEAMKVDAKDVEALAAAIKGHDLVINVVLPRFNLKIMEARLAAKVHYMDAATDLAPRRNGPAKSSSRRQTPTSSLTTTSFAMRG